MEKRSQHLTHPHTHHSNNGQRTRPEDSSVTMPAPYNLTNVSSSSNPGDLITNLNTLSGGLLGVSMILSFFMIAWIGLTLNGNGARDSFAASTFATTVLSIFFWSQGWISSTILIVFVTLSVASIALLRFRGNV